VLLADPDIPGYPHLNLDVERRNIEQALEEVPEISAEFYPDATVEMLEDALTREAHVFHFSGHGQFEGDLGVAFGSVEGEGSVVLVGDSGGALPFPAEKLAQNLRGRGVRLAVLGACEVGHRDQVNAWTGVVPALSRAGIPAVVGMQYTVQDENAIAFSRRFYRALAAGQSIDAAVTDGRLAIYNRASEDERDWGVPVLYLRADEGVLFPGARPLAVGRPAAPVRPARDAGHRVEPEAAVSPRSEARTELEKELEEFAEPLVPPPADQVDKRVLREKMVAEFSLEDLEVLCADVELALEDAGVRVQGRPLQVNLEIVGGSGKRGKVLRLIQYLDRRGYLDYLVAAMRQLRPGSI